MQQRAIARKLFVEHVVVESVQKTKIVAKTSPSWVKGSCDG